MTDTEQAPLRALEYRRAGDMDVRFADRTIELVAVPYDSDAAILVNGRWITESVAPGSFDGVERRANRVKCNRDHDVARTFGRCAALHPSRSEGLIAEVKVSHTALGDETLEMAADGLLDASVAFAPFPGGEHYLENRSRRRITKAYLGHLAMVPEAAYDAPVLAVRAASPLTYESRVATPNLDALRHAELQASFDRLRAADSG